MTVGRHVLLGTATGTVSRKIIDTEGNKHQVNLEGLIVPGLGHHLFSTSQAAKTSTTPAENMNLELLSFDLEIAEATSDEVALSAIRVPADIWHRRMRHINSKFEDSAQRRR